ncbi:MAG: hypothetical protein IPP99_04055 [Chitinophagaceae bacterium]|nr:hypothetical protein [Chitinophagaceae bacterium]
MKRITLFLFFFIALKIQAQQSFYDKVAVSSPTAASLAKYGDIPVSYHTGTPNISIPITSIKEGPLSLAVGLRYHASGIKVMEPASWVGTGWSLDCGGVITRSVQGAPDERFTSTTYDQSKGYFSDYGYHNYETGNCTVVNPSGQNSGFFCGSDFFEGRKDGEPDFFFYNFSGYSGKFYFNDDRTPVFVNGEGVKLIYDYVEGTGSIRSFTLIPPDGVKYHLEELQPQMMLILSKPQIHIQAMADFLTGTSILSWFLNKIESSDGLFSIVLKYEEEVYGYLIYPLIRLCRRPRGPMGY